MRPSIWQAKEQFDFNVRVFGGTSVGYRENCRAIMRRNIRAIIARLRERALLYNSLGLTEMDRLVAAAVSDIIEAEDFFNEVTAPTPNVIAARVLIGLTNDCEQGATAAGKGYCGTMAMALIAMGGLLPNLSGLIRDHGAFFVSNPDLPLSDQPFNAA